MTSGMPAVDALERKLAGRASRLAGRVALAWRGRHRSAGEPASGAWRQLLRPNESSLQRLTDALALALRAGALESADVLCRRLLRRLPDAPTSSRAHELAIEVLIAIGEDATALALAEPRAAELRSSPGGAILLELLGKGDDRPRLPDGRLHTVALSRRVESGSLAAEALASELLRDAWFWLRAPDALLLVAAALCVSSPQRACGFLSRFFDLHGLPGCRLSSGGGEAASLLARLHFDVPPLSYGPLVSVLISARNAEATVGYAVDSLLKQTYRSLEILVCDDASDDRTQEVLRTRYANEERVRLFRSSTNQGAYNVRNALAARARGDLLTFQDADDLAVPTRLALQVEQLRDPHTVACVSDWLRVTDDGRFVFFKDQRAQRLALVSLMLRRVVFEQLGAFRTVRFGADLELFEHLKQRFGANAVARIRKPLILALWSDRSATRSAASQALETGYRAPLRRAYSELVWQKYVAQEAISPQTFERRLRDLGNWANPAEIAEIT